MISAAIASRIVPRPRAVAVEPIRSLRTSDNGGPVYVGGDLSKVEVVPPEQIQSFHEGMLLVFAVGLIVGAVLALVGSVLGILF